MTRPKRVERRSDPRRGLALRVTLRDHRPPVHATTRNCSLGGMYLMTATRKLRTDRNVTAEIEIDRGDRRWTPPLPVRVIWADHTAAGVAFDHLPADTAEALRTLLDEAHVRSAHPRQQRERA